MSSEISIKNKETNLFNSSITSADKILCTSNLIGCIGVAALRSGIANSPALANLPVNYLLTASYASLPHILFNESMIVGEVFDRNQLTKKWKNAFLVGTVAMTRFFLLRKAQSNPLFNLPLSALRLYSAYKVSHRAITEIKKTWDEKKPSEERDWAQIAKVSFVHGVNASFAAYRAYSLLEDCSHYFLGLEPNSPTEETKSPLFSSTEKVKNIARSISNAPHTVEGKLETILLLKQKNESPDLDDGIRCGLCPEVCARILTDNKVASLQSKCLRELSRSFHPDKNRHIKEKATALSEIINGVFRPSSEKIDSGTLSKEELAQELVNQDVADATKIVKHLSAENNCALFSSFNPDSEIRVDRWKWIKADLFCSIIALPVVAKTLIEKINSFHFNPIKAFLFIEKEAKETAEKVKNYIRYYKDQLATCTSDLEKLKKKEASLEKIDENRKCINLSNEAIEQGESTLDFIQFAEKYFKERFIPSIAGTSFFGNIQFFGNSW